MCGRGMVWGVCGRGRGERSERSRCRITLTRMRKFVLIVGVMWWVAAASLLALRWVPGGVVVVALQCGLPLVGASLVLLFVLALIARLKVLSALTVLLLAPMVVLAWPWWVQADQQSPAAGDVVVMSSNMYFGAADVQELQDAVRDRGVDALVLLEVTPDALDNVEASGIPSALPYRSGRPRDGAGGTVVFTAQPHARLGTAPDLFFDQVAVEVEATGDAGKPWVLFGAHPSPPTLPDWSADLATLHEWSQQQDPNTALVMAGDFNASTAHPAFRDLEEGLTNARRVTSPGWVRTWPQAGSIPAFVDLDHVLVRGLGVVDAGQIEISGTDHSAVWARIGRSTS